MSLNGAGALPFSLAVRNFVRKYLVPLYTYSPSSCVRLSLCDLSFVSTPNHVPNQPEKKKTSL